MRPWTSAELLRSSFRFCADHFYRLIGVVALLACFAVVLNVGPYAKPAKPNVLASLAERPSGSTPIVRAQIGAAQADERSPESSPTAGIPIALAAYQPVNRPQDDATRAKVLREERAAPDPAAHSTIVGIWAPDASACSMRDFREGLLPTIINSDGAWAGETFCMFKNRKQTETGWRVVANCSNPRERWSADVRLTLKDNRLIWTSKRGTQVYTRCAPDFVVAAAR